MSAPLVLIESAGQIPPVVIEHPEGFPFAPEERELWREATDDEYNTYRLWWLGYNDALGGEVLTDPDTTTDLYAAGYAAGMAESGPGSAVGRVQ